MRWALLLLCACGGPERTPMGITIEEGPGLRPTYFTPEQVDLHAAHMLSGMEALGMSHEALQVAVAFQVLEVYPGPFEDWGRCNGELVGNTLRVAATHCVWGTALSHEMAHQMREWALGDPDAEHRDARVWALTSPLGSCP